MNPVIEPESEHAYMEAFNKVIPAANSLGELDSPIHKTLRWNETTTIENINLINLLKIFSILQIDHAYLLIISKTID